jgi:hypothetical protein
MYKIPKYPQFDAPEISSDNRTRVMMIVLAGTDPKPEVVLFVCSNYEQS